MKASRTSTPSDSNIPEPSAADLAAGIVGPMDIPVHTPIPILRLKTRRFRKEKSRIAAYRNLLKREGRKPYVSITMRHLQKMWRLRSSLGLPVTSFREKAQRLSDSLNEEFHVMQNQSSVCLCFSCQHIRRWSSTLQPYRCTNTNCRITCASFIDLYEHQLDIHGGLDPRANRIVNELYHQQEGMLALPPSTVYAGQQFLIPSRPPMPWKSMDELDEEARTLMERLRKGTQDLFVRPFNVFKTAYDLVKRNGWKEMKRQYHIAMEHYFATMKYPASSRGFHDGCPSVERGRNWLTSTDREDARILHPFNLGDKVDVELEFVLIDTKRDQEMCIELSGNEDDEDDVDASIEESKCASGQKICKIDEDVEMKESKVMMAKLLNGKKVSDFDSDNDEANRVKSEDSDSDFDAKSSGGDDNKVELKFSKLPGSASDSKSDSHSESDEDDTASKVQSSSEDDSNFSDSGVESKIIKDKARADFMSNSDSESDDDKTAKQSTVVIFKRQQQRQQQRRSVENQAKRRNQHFGDSATNNKHKSL
ncbi:unnamed protein product [Peronospora destructor]|uniref:C2H2-type domain-containing protein n=1 Tax=Peronospora destructor TaxID=86335 RepID=A0AAV0T3N4_9STRA|nr:unnamed protein product [Peronospora destructor]